MPKHDLDALLQLSLIPGLGPTLTRRCLETFGSPAASLQAAPDQLATIDGIGQSTAIKIRRHIEQTADGKQLAEEKDLIARHGVTLIPIGDKNYPQLLSHIPDPPPLLYVKGKLKSSDAVALAVVGARRCTAYGREQADRLTALCAQTGLCIVSGGARGIDATAHRAAIRAGGRTIAVLGSGIAKPYPNEHAELFDDIAANHGAIISELPMNTSPNAQNFPRRNRIISGLSLGVLVVEAALRSGAHITARLAAEEHNREVMALPGRVDSPTSGGCHKMIREGWAALVTSAAEVIQTLSQSSQLLRAQIQDELDVFSAPVQPAGPPAPLEFATKNLTNSQHKILKALEEPSAFDHLLHHTQLAISTLQADLTMLEILGLITRDQGKFQRRSV